RVHTAAGPGLAATWPSRISLRLLVGDAGLQIGDLLSNRNAGDPQIAARAEVALHQNTDCVAALLCGQLARGGADAALESETGHPRPTANDALFRQAARRRVERVENVLFLHVKAVDVVQISI